MHLYEKWSKYAFAYAHMQMHTIRSLVITRLWIVMHLKITKYALKIT
jgi:hypothetical protein